MTAGEVQRGLQRYCEHNGWFLLSPNTYAFGWESDLLAIRRNGITAEFEIKVSKSDFNNDLFKDKFQKIYNPDHPRPNYFYYVCPRDLIHPSELLPEFGLLYVNKEGTECHSVKRAKRLHEGSISFEILFKVARSLEARFWQGRRQVWLYKNRLRERDIDPSTIKEIF